MAVPCPLKGPPSFVWPGAVVFDVYTLNSPSVGVASLGQAQSSEQCILLGWLHQDLAGISVRQTSLGGFSRMSL